MIRRQFSISLSENQWDARERIFCIFAIKPRIQIAASAVVSRRHISRELCPLLCPLCYLDQKPYLLESNSCWAAVASLARLISTTPKRTYAMKLAKGLKDIARP